MKEFMITPAEQRVVVLPDETSETKTNSGIIIPRTVEDNMPEIATVVAVGNGSADNPMEFFPTQRVVYSQYSGVELKLNLQGDGEHVYKVMNQMDIMAVVKEVD